MVGSNDLARSKAFYDALFAVSGAGSGVEDARGRLIYTHKGARLMISKPIDGNPASGANGGTSVEDPPGERQGGSGRLYLAYLRDLDGNKLCARHRIAG